VRIVAIAFGVYAIGAGSAVAAMSDTVLAGVSFRRVGLALAVVGIAVILAAALL
jgi:hypothetical protein